MSEIESKRLSMSDLTIRERFDLWRSREQKQKNDIFEPSSSSHKSEVDDLLPEQRSQLELRCQVINKFSII
jgi:hypothetical protein